MIKPPNQPHREVFEQEYFQQKKLDYVSDSNNKDYKSENT